jgi:hypothetical protein
LRLIGLVRGLPQFAAPWRRWLGVMAAAFTLTPVVCAAQAQPSAGSSTAPLWAAVITGTVTMIGLIVQLGHNARMARRLEQKTAETEQRQRQRELALKIVDTIATDRTAARRFALGLVKIEWVGHAQEQSEKSDERGKVFFIPVNSRITVGRDAENDINLYDPTLKTEDTDFNRHLSRFQCGLVADQHDVVVEDFHSANGTLVSDPNGSKRLKIGNTEVRFSAVRHMKLADGDRIWVGPFVLRFLKLQENKILMQ